MSPGTDSGRWRRLEEVFHAALQMEPAERRAYLEHSCGDDPELRREAEALLAVPESTLQLLRAPVERVAEQFLLDAPGSDIRLGAYRLTRALGEGGMGRVYLGERADGQYRSRVAVKVMRASFGASAEMQSRFRAERQILADLNHPNIARLLDGGTTPSGLPYLVMEFIDGMAIDDFCRARRLSVGDRLKLFCSICSAVEYAHGKLVIHRDLKPGNILVTPDGTPKLLDFGIAKLVEPERAGLPASQTSHTGRLMTLDYASPEQVRGEPVTKATDIYSLGTVLYELLTGRRPFNLQDTSPMEAMRVICETDPALPSTVIGTQAGLTSPGDVGAAPALDYIVLRAMRKSPQDRFGSVAEMAESVRTYLAGVTTPSAPGTWAAAPRKRLRNAILAGLAIVAAALLRFAWPTSPPPAPFNTMQITRLTTRGKVAAAAISPDGRFVVYALDEASGQSLWIRQLAVASDIRVLAPEDTGHTALTFSPDGNFIYYIAQNGAHPDTVFQLPVLGGNPKPVSENVFGPITFAPGGKEFAFVRQDVDKGEGSIVIANADGSGERNLLTKRKPFYLSRSALAWSPDGRSILYGTGNATFYVHEAFHLAAYPVAGGHEESIGAQTWAQLGSSIWADSHTLVVAGHEQSEVEGLQIWLVTYPSGTVRRVTNDLNNYATLSLTSDGKTLVAVQSERSADIWAIPSREAGRANRLTSGDLRELNSIAWAPSGSILYSALTGDYLNIWTMDPEGRDAKPLTAGPGDKAEVAATRDGRYIFYQLSGKIWRMNSDGNNQLQLTHGALDVHPTATPDSKWVYYASFADWSPAIGGKPGLFKMSVNGQGTARVGDFSATFPQVSPDGKLIVCVHFPAQDFHMSSTDIALISTETGRVVRILPWPAGAGRHVYWSPDGRSLEVVRTLDGASNVWRLPMSGGPPVELTNLPTDEIFDLAWSFDGGKLAATRGRALSDVVLIRHFK